MTSRYPTAVTWSAMLHMAVIALVLLVSYIAQKNLRNAPLTFELVAGEGDNFEATEAPALGNVEKLQTPAPPTPVPVPRTEAPPTPSVQPTPQTAPSPAVIPSIPAPKAPSLTSQAKNITKEAFDKANAGKKQPAAPRSTAPKAPQIDVAGITKGVRGGSTDNKTGGARGTALTREDGRVMDAYFAFFKQRLREEIALAPGLSDTLTATLRVVIMADGTITQPEILKKSRSPEFDRAILAAIARIKLRPRPDGKTETVDVPINLRDLSAP